MENSNNTGKMLAVFTAVVFLFFIYEVMTNTSKVSQVNIPQKQPSVPNINIINEPTFDPKLSISDNSVTKQENTSITERNINNRNIIRRTRRRPENINVIDTSSNSSSNSNSD